MVIAGQRVLLLAHGLRFREDPLPPAERLLFAIMLGTLMLPFHPRGSFPSTLSSTAWDG
jgi:hypothetical protein